jgi:hypothetical protein
MADIMLKYLGDSIFYVPDDYNKTEAYPSPSELKYKVVKYVIE